MLYIKAEIGIKTVHFHSRDIWQIHVQYERRQTEEKLRKLVEHIKNF